jgi:MoxR-like ATPase
MNTSKALALFDGQEFVTPEQVQEIAVSVIAHRMVMDPQARFSGRTAEGVVEEILEEVPVPA